MLGDDRNRMIKVFFEYAVTLQPAYMLMETVENILTLDNGSLIRSIMRHLIYNDYQVSSSIIKLTIIIVVTIIPLL